MNAQEAVEFVEQHGIVLQSARGPVPNLAEAVAGEAIRGSWWGHAKGKAIYSASQSLSNSSDILVCRLVNGKVTYVHRRLWPALVKLASRFPKDDLAKIWEEHTNSGKHVSRREDFPTWVPHDVIQTAETVSVQEAEKLLSALLTGSDLWKK